MREKLAEEVEKARASCCGRALIGKTFCLRALAVLAWAPVPASRRWLFVSDVDNRKHLSKAGGGVDYPALPSMMSDTRIRDAGEATLFF